MTTPAHSESYSAHSTIIAGPIVRHCDVSQLNFWLVTTTACDFTFKLFIEQSESDHSLLFEVKLSASDELSNKKSKSHLKQIQIGESAFINLISIYAEEHLPDNSIQENNLVESSFSASVFPENTVLYYDILTSQIDKESSDKTKSVSEGESITGLQDLLYAEQSLPSLVIKPKIEKLLHGSCRKPHYKGDDGLKQVDSVLESAVTQAIHSKIDSEENTQSTSNIERPSMLIMSGDQIYVDDVAGPTLSAIHQVIELLGLYNEEWLSDDPAVTNSQALFKHKHCYYQRQHLLPNFNKNTLFGEKTTPIFTSVSVHNHLITLSEIMAMYLLTWSPELWNRVDITKPPANLSAPLQEKYAQELKHITDFYQGLYQVRRAMAHIPVYMIFDDHDVTDDWNLTRGWEEAAYTHPFSKQIIGNAVAGYWLCQGVGNAPDKFTQLLEKHNNVFSEQGYQHKDDLIDELLAFDQWNYTLSTSPKIVVLDTRTQRWRSESNANKPSGLMDWETLTDFQQEIVKEPNVIVVSPAPIYGVKLIETIQKVFTLCGKPLAVDAENWMAHSGTANVILNIFRNPRTPPNFIILSGDVHYSFVYDVTHRFRKNKAKITQITCSGIKNTFPDKLLTTLEKLNKVLYAPYSPLNWFTKRRRMKVRVRKPNIAADTHLLNSCGIGVLRLEDGNEEVITEFITSQGKMVEFIQHEADED